MRIDAEDYSICSGVRGRLAGVLHAARAIEQGEAVQTPISRAEIEAAIQLHQYFLASVLKILNIGSPAEQSRKAAHQCVQAILWGWDRWEAAPDGRIITPRVVQRGIRGASASMVQEGLRWLVDVGLLTEAHQ